jgi:HAMP domain-containing protein
LRQANGIIAGITGMHWRRFLVFNAIGAALWVGTWVSLGYLAGHHIGTIYHYITQYSNYVLITLAGLLAGFIAWRLLRRMHRRATSGRQSANGQPSKRRPSPSKTASTESAASQPAGARPPHREASTQFRNER